VSISHRISKIFFMTNKEKYNWKGNNLVYSERHGWHLRPTASREQTMKEHNDYLKKTGELRDVSMDTRENKSNTREE